MAPLLTDGATDTPRAVRLVYGDFRRLTDGHDRCHYRAAEWGHKERAGGA